MGSHTNIDADGLREMMREPHVLVDVRTDREVMERGLIPGSLHIPLHTLPARLDDIGTDYPVIIYCQSGVRSVQASNFLAQNGHDRIYNLVGGFADWTARGFPVART